MDDLTQIIEQISNKLKILEKKNYLLEKENNLLKDRIQKMESIINKNKNIEEEIKIMRISKSVSFSKKEKKNLKLYINKLIQDIDICISQINELNKI